MRTIIREERIPFSLQTEIAFREAAQSEYVKAELEKAKLDANDPNTKWLPHTEIMASLNKQREARR